MRPMVERGCEDKFEECHGAVSIPSLNPNFNGTHFFWLAAQQYPVYYGACERPPSRL